MPGLLSRLSSSRRTQPVPGLSIPAAPADPEQAGAALGLAREVLHSIEQFVIPTPDLDTHRFLHRLRGTAAGLTAAADAPTLLLYRNWAKSALAAFGALQRRSITERETEMWRLLDAYAKAAQTGSAGASSLIEELRHSHERLGQIGTAEDLRALREQLTEEVKHAQRLVEQQAREQKDRVAGLAREVSRLEAALAEVRGRANIDVLTGILHRGAFQQQLHRIIEEGKPCTLAILDVDNFKTINDTLGHIVGDRVLAVVAEQLRRVARTTDLVGRFGGDEYCFVSLGSHPDQLAQRIAGVAARRQVRLDMEDRTCAAILSLSTGIAGSEQGESPESLLDRADQALLAAKQAGKGGIRLAAPRAA